MSWLRKQLETADVYLLREMVRSFAETLMSAEADDLCGADCGERSQDRVNRRNGYRERDFDTRAGTIELRVPKLRQGSYYPDWLLERRRRAERALGAVICECYARGVSTRRVDGLVKILGMEGISKSQVSALARTLDAEVAAFRSRPLDAGPIPATRHRRFAWLQPWAGSEPSLRCLPSQVSGATLSIGASDSLRLSKTRWRNSRSASSDW